MIGFELLNLWQCSEFESKNPAFHFRMTKSILNVIESKEFLLASLPPNSVILAPELPNEMITDSFLESHIGIPISESQIYTINNRIININNSINIKTGIGFPKFSKSYIMDDYLWHGLTVYQISDSLSSPHDYTTDPLPKYFKT